MNKQCDYVILLVGGKTGFVIRLCIASLALLCARVVCILVHESCLATDECCAVNPLHMYECVNDLIKFVVCLSHCRHIF